MREILPETKDGLTGTEELSKVWCLCCGGRKTAEKDFTRKRPVAAQKRQPLDFSVGKHRLSLRPA